MLDLSAVNLDELAMALEDQDDGDHCWLLDPRTGELAFWTSDLGIDGENPVEIDELDLVAIDPVPSYVWYQDMVDFAEGISDPVAGRRLAQWLAQEVVQGVLVRLAARDLGEVTNLVGYATRSIVNDVHLHGRRGGIFRRLLPRLAPHDEPASTDRTATIDDGLRLWAAMDRLSPVQRAALVLRYYEDLDDAAIADVLGCAPATVRSHLSRGLVRLRPLITQEDP